MVLKAKELLLYFLDRCDNGIVLKKRCIHHYIVPSIFLVTSLALKAASSEIITATPVLF